MMAYTTCVKCCVGSVPIVYATFHTRRLGSDLKLFTIARTALMRSILIQCVLLCTCAIYMKLSKQSVAVIMC